MHDVIGCVNHTLSLAVLRGGVCGVIEITAIVALNGLDGEAELSGNPSEKVVERGMSQTWHVREKSTKSEKNHQPPQDSTYSQKY
jgi:hypothetical protein